MKTAISLPNDLFVLADEFARSLGISRSELYTMALREYIQSHVYVDLTERINAACATLETQLPADIADTTRRKLLEAEW
jgi:metal-responsive CopG/Arc/MetJ family transcriptional regulator